METAAASEILELIYI